MHINTSTSAHLPATSVVRPQSSCLLHIGSEYKIMMVSFLRQVIVICTCGCTDISLSSTTLTGPPAWIRPPKNICPVNLGFLSRASMRCRSRFLTNKAPGVGDIVLPHVSVQPVGEVEEPGGILSQQICSPHSFWSGDTNWFGKSVQNNFVLGPWKICKKNRESWPVVHTDQDVRHHSGHLGHDPPLNLKHGK